MSVNSYKFDDRTEKEFIKDLEKGLKNEATATNIFREILLNSTVENPDVVYVGSDEEGKVSYNSDNKVANVDLFPDYLLKYKESRRIRFNFIEVKLCNPHSREAYFKVKQLEQYKEISNVVILFIMGFSTKNPKFILVEPDEILELGIEPEDVYGKQTIKAPAWRFNWLDFDPSVKRGDLLNTDYIKEFEEINFVK